MHDTTLHDMEPQNEEFSSLELPNTQLSDQEPLHEELANQNPSGEDASDKAPSSIRSAILQPISPDYLPDAKSEEPLFLPPHAQRRWYLGYLQHWKDYQRNVITHWESAGCKRVFDELRKYELDEPRSAATTEGKDHTTSDNDSAVGDNTVGEDNTFGEDKTGPAKLEDKFRREVAEIVEVVYNEMLITSTMKHLDANRQPECFLLEKAMMESRAKPRFSFRAKPVDQNLEPKARVTGHVEYLGGRPGALTWAVGEAAKNSWGSLRCVLGDIAWCMLKADTSYGFVVSSDEIIFLRFDINTCVEEVDINFLKPDLYPLFDWVDVLEEPDLWYTDPIKFTDAFDTTEGKITVKMGLLHLIHEVVIKEWKMQEDKGKCAMYFQKTEAGERWKPRPPRRN